MVKKHRKVDIKEFSLNNIDIVIRGKLFDPVESEEFLPIIILCHGIPSGRPRVLNNPENGYDYLGKMFALQGFKCIVFNFRGTGMSSGDLDLDGWVKDLQAVMVHFKNIYGINAREFVLMGFSAGAAVSVEVAAGNTDVKALALAACPANFSFLSKIYSLEEMICWMKEIGVIRKEEFPPDPNQWWERMIGVRPEDSIHLNSCRQVLIMHGESDDLIPCKHAQLLYEKAGVGKRLVTFPGLGHSLREEGIVIRYLQSWLEEIKAWYNNVSE